VADDLRHRYAEAIRTAADFSIVGEWICCNPVNPEHDLCVKGDIARQMLAAVLADDPERLFVPSKLVDAVMAVRDEELERLRLIAKVNHGLYGSAQQEAGTAEAALSLVRERLDILIAAGFGAVTDTLRELRAALDDQEADRG
jgi:hypothetical protein